MLHLKLIELDLEIGCIIVSLPFFFKAYRACDGKLSYAMPVFNFRRPRRVALVVYSAVELRP